MTTGNAPSAKASTTKVAVVTGASAGIGQACANRLEAGEWQVVGTSRRGTSSGHWAPMVMDVDDDASVGHAIATIVERYGRIDALVAAAGWGLAGALEETPVAEAKAQFETNFFGVVRTLQAVLPTMRAQHSGRVALISSLGGIIGLPFQAFYSASKFAVEGLAESAAYEVAPFGVSLTLVEPGNIVTEFTERRRLVSGPADGNLYRAARDKAIKVMERDERNGAPPDDVAKVVQKVLQMPRPPRRVSVGKAGERVGVVAKRVLPFRVFEAAAKGSLGV